ncbi:MAG: cytochrome c oxidase subunit II [Pseudomonadota bacterium]
MFHVKHFRAFLGFFIVSIFSVSVYASAPEQWQIGFQAPATPTMERIESLHNILLIVIGLIALFVFCLIGYILWRFRASKNKSPSTRSHNPVLEIIWTTVPVLILVFIAFPSFKLMYYLDKVPEPEMTIKISGAMWYWNYEYPEHKIEFDSRIIKDQDLADGQIRLLSVDNELVVPVNTNVRLLFTASDVIHSWGVPAFGVKKDCVPGRLNEAWIKVTKEGTFYGQCYELCGMDHGFMPVAVRAVSKQEFTQWLQQQSDES